MALSHQTSLFCFQENNCSVLVGMLEVAEYFKPDARAIALHFVCFASIAQFSSALHKVCVVVGCISLK